uniref:Uncharacterized protein n=1 Tax=Arundo donax TaxID=35708 RepID=A0A0A8ZQM2_ARUDO
MAAVKHLISTSKEH